MSPTPYKSRVYLLAARSAPRIVILQRKRSRLFHIISIETKKSRVEEGSWFRGKLYVGRCDISFDGNFMVYLAMGATGNTWNGLCRLPRLKTLVSANNTGTYNGGGYFQGQRLLRTNGWLDIDSRWPEYDHPFDLEPYKAEHGGDLGVIYARLRRDGFVRRGGNWGEAARLPTKTYQVAQYRDDGWVSQRYRQLTVRYVGYLQHGYTFAFSLDDYPGLLDGASWATWDACGQLWVARPGTVERFTDRDLRRGTPSLTIDVDQFEPPQKVDADSEV